MQTVVSKREKKTVDSDLLDKSFIEFIDLREHYFHVLLSNDKSIQLFLDICREAFETKKNKLFEVCNLFTTLNWQDSLAVKREKVEKIVELCKDIAELMAKNAEDYSLVGHGNSEDKLTEIRVRTMSAVKLIEESGFAVYKLERRFFSKLEEVFSDISDYHMSENEFLDYQKKVLLLRDLFYEKRVNLFKDNEWLIHSFFSCYGLEINKDLAQSARLGLWQALDKFDFQSNSFFNYAFNFIKTATLECWAAEHGLSSRCEAILVKKVLQKYHELSENGENIEFEKVVREFPKIEAEKVVDILKFFLNKNQALIGVSKIFESDEEIYEGIEKEDLRSFLYKSLDIVTLDIKESRKGLLFCMYHNLKLADIYNVDDIQRLLGISREKAELIFLSERSFSTAEIAEMLGVTVQKVQWGIRKIAQKMRELFFSSVECQRILKNYNIDLSNS